MIFKIGQKYELTNETVEHEGRTLHRIRTLRTFNEDSIEEFKIIEGDLGGFIENAENLSQEGNAWVYSNAKVYDRAKVYENVKVFHEAQVFGNASVSDEAMIFGNAKIYGNASIYDNAKVHDVAEVFDNAKVYGNADVCNIAKIYDNAKVYGSAWIVGTQELHGNTEIWLSPEEELSASLIDNDLEVSQKEDNLHNELTEMQTNEFKNGILYIVEKKVNSLEMEGNKNSLFSFKNDHPELITDSKYNNLLNRLSEDWCLFDAVSYSHNLDGINDIYMKTFKNYPNDEFRIVKAECCYNDNGISCTDYDYKRLEVLKIEDIYKQMLMAGSIVKCNNDRLMYINNTSDNAIEAYRIYSSEEVPKYAQSLKIDDVNFHDKTIVFDKRYWLKINSIKKIQGTLLTHFANKVCNIVDYLDERNLIKDYSNSPMENIKKVFNFHMKL